MPRPLDEETKEEIRAALMSPSRFLSGASFAWCVECELVFDMTNEDDANEWHYGHDCEA